MPGAPAAAHGAAVDDPDRADPRVRVPHPLRVRPHADQPQGPARSRRTSRSATTSPPTTRRARCAGPASSSCCSSIFHLMDLTWGNANPQFVRGDPYNNLVYSLQRPAVAIVYIVANIALGVPPVPRRLVDVPEPGHHQPAHTTSCAGAFAQGFAGFILVGNLSFPIAGAAARGRRCKCPHTEPTTAPCTRTSVTMTLDSQDPRRPARREVGQPQVRHQARQPREQAPVRDHRRRHRPRRRVGRPRASAELGYNVKVITFHDSPRRAHSIAAQGGINAAKNYPNDGDSVYRLFYDTIKGGDYRSREANVYRLAQVSVDIIDQCVAQGVPFAREYGGLLDNRSLRRRAGVAHVLRAGPDRPAAAARRVPGADAPGARGQRARSTRAPRCSTSSSRTAAPPASCAATSNTGEVFSMSGHAVVLATGGYGNAFYLSTNAKNSNVTAAWRAAEAGRVLRQPLLHADPPHVHPGERRLPVEAHADVGVVAQRRPRLGAEADGRHALARPDPRGRPRLLPRAPLPVVRQPRRRATSRRARSSARSTPGRGVGPLKNGVYLDFARRDRAPRPRRDRGALRQPLRDVRAHHRRGPVRRADAHLPRRPLHDGRALGRLQPDEQRARAVRARRGELLRPRRQPARRVGAHAGPRRRLLRAAVHDQRLPRAAARRRKPVPVDDPAFKDAEHVGRRAGAQDARRSTATRTVDDIHRELGKVLWDNCGMARTEQSLTKALSEIPAIREEFWKNVRVLGENETRNQSLEKAGRVADFLEFGELHGARRAAPQRELRRPLPRGVPDRRGRGAPRRRALQRTSPRGSSRASAPSPSCTRSRSSSSTSTRRPVRTSREDHRWPTTRCASR